MSDDAPVTLTTEYTDMLTEWFEVQKQLAPLKAREMALRRNLFETAFPSPVPGKGNKARLPHGMGLIGNYTLNYTVDQPAMFATRPDIDPVVFDEVISFSPSVRDAAFRKLADDIRRPFTGFITVKPGSPSLEIKPADKIRWNSRTEES